MKTIKPRKIALAGTVVAAVALVGCLGCAAQTQTADTGAAQEPVQQEQTEQQAAAPEKVAKKTLAEWVTTYPNQGNSYMEAKMAHTYDAFAGASQQAFGGEDAAVACAACHAREDFQTVYNEQGETILDKNASDYEMEWSNCTNCHVGDPGEGKVEGGNAYGDATSVSAKALFPEEDYVCGQCHAMFPGAAYLEDANKGIDQYKYGFEPEEMLRAMKEYYEANPVTETTICAGMVGVPMLDPEIDTMLYLTDACTELELFQDGNHQKMGLTCTDCHMPQTEAADGAIYTHHNMTQSPLENPAALEKCLTCHKSQGVEDADAMVTFVKGKMDELAQIQQATKTKLDEFHAKLAEVVAAGNADETKLQAAKDAYNLANVYFLYQGTAMRPTDGSMAAMNFSKSVEQLQKADDAIAEGMAQIA